MNHTSKISLSLLLVIPFNTSAMDPVAAAADGYAILQQQAAAEQAAQASTPILRSVTPVDNTAGPIASPKAVTPTPTALVSDDDDIKSARYSGTSLASARSSDKLAASDGFLAASTSNLRPVSPAGDATSAPLRSLSPAVPGTTSKPSGLRAVTSSPAMKDSGGVADDAPYEHTAAPTISDADHWSVEHAWPSNRTQFRNYAETIEAAIYRAESKDDSHRRDAIAIRCWAQSLEHQGDMTPHFIIVPKKALDAALNRLNELAVIYKVNQIQVTAETNYTNPKGMGIIDTFTEELVLSAPAVSASPASLRAALSDTAHEDNSATPDKNTGNTSTPSPSAATTSDNSSPAAASASSTTAASSGAPALPPVPARVDTPALPTVTVEYSDFFNLMDQPEFVVVKDAHALLEYVNTLKTAVIQKTHDTWRTGRVTEVTDISDAEIVYTWVSKLLQTSSAAPTQATLIPKIHFENVITKLKTLVERYARASLSIKVDISLDDPAQNNIIFDNGFPFSFDSEAAAAPALSASAPDDDDAPALPTDSSPRDDDSNGAAPALPTDPSPAHRGDDSSSICSSSSSSSENQKQNCEFLPSAYVKELAQCARKVQDAIGDKITATREEDAHLLPAKIETDFDDASEIAEWAHALDTAVQGNTDKKVIILSEALRKAIQRLKPLAGRYAPKSFSDDSFATEPLRYDPATSTGMHLFNRDINFSVTTDNGNSSDTGSYTGSSDDGVTNEGDTTRDGAGDDGDGSVSGDGADIAPTDIHSAAAGAAAATTAETSNVYCEVRNSHTILEYALQVQNETNAWLANLSNARIKEQATADTNDIANICTWLNAVDTRTQVGKKAVYVSRSTFDKVIARLRRIAATYSKRNDELTVISIDAIIANPSMNNVYCTVYAEPISFAEVSTVPSAAPVTHILPLDDDDDVTESGEDTAPIGGGAAGADTNGTAGNAADIAAHSPGHDDDTTVCIHTEDIAAYAEHVCIAIEGTGFGDEYSRDVGVDHCEEVWAITAWANKFKNSDGSEIIIPRSIFNKIMHRLNFLARAYGAPEKIARISASSSSVVSAEVIATSEQLLAQIDKTTRRDHRDTVPAGRTHHAHDDTLGAGRGAGAGADDDEDVDDKGPGARKPAPRPATRVGGAAPKAPAPRTGGTPGTSSARVTSWSLKDRAIKLVTNKFVLAGGAAAAVWYWFYYMDDSTTTLDGEDVISAAKSAHTRRPVEVV